VRGLQTATRPASIRCSHSALVQPSYPSAVLARCRVIALASYPAVLTGLRPAHRTRNPKSSAVGHSFRDAYHAERRSSASAKESTAEAKVSDFAHCRNS
jgi:hypothetical protein